jgi:hypothetical protein
MKTRWIPVLAFLAALPLAAQTLAPQAKAPSVDGAIAAGEYAFETSYAGMRLLAALSADGSRLYLALSAPTKGWVAIGLGSLTMDGSYMAMGYDKDGTSFVAEERGKGHLHSPSGEKRLEASAVKEAGASTVIEIAVKAAGFVDQGKLRLLISYGARDDIRSLHAKYGRLELAVAR